MVYNPLNAVSTAIYLEAYIMEAVGFAEFINEEAVQQGIRLLKQIKKQKDYTTLIYMYRKFTINIMIPAWDFHINMGTLNPFTFTGFEIFFNVAWQTLDEIMTEED